MGVRTVGIWSRSVQRCKLSMCVQQHALGIRSMLRRPH